MYGGLGDNVLHIGGEAIPLHAEGQLQFGWIEILLYGHKC